MRSLVATLTLTLVVSASAFAAPKRAADPLGHITVDLYQADLRNVLRLLADVGGVNIVISEAVTGSITLKLKNVAWREALAMVLAQSGLESEEHDQLILVDRAETFAKRRSAQRTEREQCLASAPLRTRIVRVSYADANAMAAHVRAELTPRGRVSVDTRTNSLIVSDVDCP